MSRGRRGAEEGGGRRSMEKRRGAPERSGPSY